MRSISTIRTKRDADLEERRESLRNMRWARRRNMLLTCVGIGVLASARWTNELEQGARLVLHLLA